MAPGEHVMKKKKQSGHFEACNNIYKATRSVTLYGDDMEGTPFSESKRKLLMK